MTRRRIICDIDGVVADLHTEWYRRYNADWHDNLTVEKVTSWDLTKFVKPECGANIFAYLLQPDLYEQVQPIEGAIEAVKELQSRYNVLFATGCAFGTADQKVWWLQRYGLTEPEGVFYPKNFVAIQRKELLVGDILIEDHPETVLRWLMVHSEGAAIHFLRPWGDPHIADLYEDHRCAVATSWAEVLEILEMQEKEFFRD